MTEIDRWVANDEMGVTGLEPPAKPSGKTPISETGGANSGASDAESIIPDAVEASLWEVIEAWPSMPAGLRDAVLSIVRSSGEVRG